MQNASSCWVPRGENGSNSLVASPSTSEIRAHSKVPDCWPIPPEMVLLFEPASIHRATTSASKPLVPMVLPAMDGTVIGTSYRFHDVVKATEVLITSTMLLGEPPPPKSW